ncbi:MAG: LLM class flavin-dependent oxidoreductase [Dehalococcoidia bacterium]
MNGKRWHLGLMVAEDRGLPPRQLLALCRQAEALGYDSFWLWEGCGREVFSDLTYLALHTRTIGLGAGVIDVYSRSPTLLAQTAASLDDLSGGRLALALAATGVVDFDLVEHWHGLPHQSPQRRLREVVAVLRLALSGQRVDYQGRVFRLGGFGLALSPLQRHIPVLVAALGPSAVSVAGEVGDGWLAPYLPPRALSFFRAQLAAGARRVGRNGNGLLVRPLVLACAAAEPQQALAAVRRHLAQYIGGSGNLYHLEIVQRYGFGRRASAIKHLWILGRWRQALSLVSDEMVDALAAVGTPDECRRRLAERWAAYDVQPIVALPWGAPIAVLRATLEALAPLLQH